MVEETIHFLSCKPGGIYVDGTVGGGGHAVEILRKSEPSGILIGIDRDEEALTASEKTLKFFGDRKFLIKGNFAGMKEILGGVGINHVDGILLDLGVSSHQFDTAERGFSFTSNASLDMRMDRSRGPTAADLVNDLSEQELKRIIREYGEEPMAGRIAKAITRRRTTSRIQTAMELADIVLHSVSPLMRSKRIHPATRTFQALRITVNDELASLHRAIQEGTEVLKKGGRLVVISFHSLEDRIVKNLYQSWEKGCICPPDFPQCVCGRQARFRVMTRKPVLPGEGEIITNPRARSAKLRAAERI
jgi:16S rRNA (cytosine1402-N4)-methyltransferase